jgi:membrane protease YdiL (CAAX protease family)
MNVFVEDGGRLRSGWRFLLAALWVALSYFLVEMLVRILGGNLQFYLAVAPPLTCFLLFGGFVLLARSVDDAEQPAEYLGLGAANHPSFWFVGALLGVGLVALVVAIMFLTKSYAPGALHFDLGAIALVVWTLFWAGLSEELAFRSYPFGRLSEALGSVARRATKEKQREWGGWAAGAITGILFGVVHLHNPHTNQISFVNTALIGVLFAGLMLRTHSLWLLWGFHFFWNLTLGMFCGLPVSGLRFFSVIHEARTPGPQWLTGGAYGIEASAVATGVILLALIVVARIPTRSTRPALPGIQPE